VGVRHPHAAEPNADFASVAGAGTVIVLRLVSVRFSLKLPAPHAEVGEASSDGSLHRDID
jgi:hypothetical protein